MMRSKSILIIASIFVLCLQTKSIAATYAYFFSKDRVYKIDVVQNKIVLSQALPYKIPVGILKKTVFYDKRIKSLMVLVGDIQVKISVVDLKTFQIKRDLSDIYLVQDSDLPTIILPPSGDNFFVKSIDQDTAQEITTKFSNADFTKKGEITNFPLSYEFLGYSSDGSRVYSIKFASHVELSVYDSIALTLIETRDLDNVFINKNNPWSIESYISDAILFSESSTSIPSDAQNTDIFYVYKIIDKLITSRINANIKGDNSMLSPNKKLVVVSETKLQFIHQNTYEGINTGKIFVFNIENGTKVGTVNLSVDKFCKIIGISPDNTRAYIISRIPLSIEYKLSIIDLTKMSIITEIPKISFGREMIFIDE